MSNKENIMEELRMWMAKLRKPAMVYVKLNSRYWVETWNTCSEMQSEYLFERSHKEHASIFISQEIRK